MELNTEIKEKIATTIVAAAAAFAVTKAVDLAWKLATGQQPPTEEDDNSVLKVVVFAGVTAMAASWARQFALRKTNSYIAAHPFGQK
ncbi:DUF4235 domain-containing protein [Actinomyces sp. F1_1611]